MSFNSTAFIRRESFVFWNCDTRQVFNAGRCAVLTGVPLYEGDESWGAKDWWERHLLRRRTKGYRPPCWNVFPFTHIPITRYAQ